MGLYDKRDASAPLYAAAPRTTEMLAAAAAIVAALEPLTESERKRVVHTARIMLGVASDD